MATPNLNAEPVSVLVIDDEPGMRTALQANFLRHGWQVDLAKGVEEATALIKRQSFDLILSDVRMRDGSGFEVLRAVRTTCPETPVILLTAYGSVPDAVTSMRDGALDYLTKPVAFDRLQAAAARIMQQRNPSESPKESPQAIETEICTASIVGRSPLLLKTINRAKAAASANADVLIEAESGTGKEVLARFIHESGSRNNAPFVAVNCAAVPETLLESELFGHARGAFTGANAAKPGKFEMANGGTILLDEIGEMPMSLQPKLLRVLQEREIQRLGESRNIPVNLRVIATTNASLTSMVEHGTFRSDLYYRLNVIPLSIPPLRDRREDIPLLAAYFTEKFSNEFQRPLPALSAGFLDRLQCHGWPGNVRELANFMRRVLSLHPVGVIEEEHFLEEFKPAGYEQATKPPLPTAGTPIAVLERMHLENTLALAKGNRTHAAEMLGISIRTMRNKIREYGLPPRRYSSCQMYP